MKKANAEELIGKKFGKLTVISIHRLGKYLSNTKYFCDCSCGGKTTALGAVLKRAQVKSCGCLLKKQKKLKNQVSTYGLFRARPSFITRKYRNEIESEREEKQNFLSINELKYL